MCGIAGLWVPGGAAESELRGAAAAMTRALAHRGPDGDGIWSAPDAGLVLGHRRLAIVDLSPAGHQPMISANERLALVFNGEIYNHLDMRRELEQTGLAGNWRGHSDTETLLAAFAAWGFATTLQKVVGMFALALWDRADKTLRLARDRMGEKPLYYGWVGGAFAFASELKALRQVPGFDNPIDRNALALYMQFCAVPAPHSIYSGILKLAPGTSLAFSQRDLEARALPSSATWWSVADVACRELQRPVADDAEAISELERLIRQSLRGQMVADVPLGAFLSGGIDSSTIVALMQSQTNRPVKTFTIGFDEFGFDESADAAAVARHLGTDHHEIRIKAADALDVIPTLPRMFDEPFADSSQIPTHLVSRAAREHVTVALSGDGGDELFGGYSRYSWIPRIWRRVGWMPAWFRQLIADGLLSVPAHTWDALSGITRVRGLGAKVHKLGGRLDGVGSMEELYHRIISEWSPRSAAVNAVPRDQLRIGAQDRLARITDPAQRMMLLDMLGYLPDDILTKVDRAAMACSLETRVPFLDHNLVEFAWRLPLEMKIREGQGKWILRQVLYKYVPRDLIERPKAGFAIPLGSWLRGPLRDWAESLLDRSKLLHEGYFDVSQISLKWQEHLNGRRDWSASLWCVLMFEAWLDQQEG